MGPTARRAAVLTAALFLLGTGTALADEPGTAGPQGPITLSPEQVTRVCATRVPGVLGRIDRVTARLAADASTPGSTAWLAARRDEAQAAGRGDDADRIQERIDGRPAVLDRLAGARQRLTAFRDASCAP